MWTKLRNMRFSHDEDGAVTTDWVVLTAAVVGISLVGGFKLVNPLLSATSDVADEIENFDPTTTGSGSNSGTDSGTDRGQSNPP